MRGEWISEWLQPANPPGRPFLKWAGGKRRLVGALSRFVGPIPVESIYYEPFLGSGALFFALMPSQAVLSDTNSALVETFRVVKERVSELIAYLSTLPRRPTRDQYYTNRDRFNDLIVSQKQLSHEQKLAMAALLIWLNHTCFNGLYRVNNGGQFNVPVGSNSEPFIFSPESLRKCSATLRRSRASLMCGDYSAVLAHANEGDRVYLDPPYEIDEGTSEFTAYTKEGFSSEDQKALAETVRTLADRGVRVVMSNSASRLVKMLYKDYDIHPIDAPRSISREGTGRGKVSEVIVVA